MEPITLQTHVNAHLKLFIISIIFLMTIGGCTSIKDEQTVKLYYYNTAMDQGSGGAQCSKKGLVAVTRTLPDSTTLIEDTLKLLLQGQLTEDEKNQGFTTEFPLSGVMLENTGLRDGVLTLIFSDPQNKTSGGSCRVSILWHEIEATAKQFSEVREVRFFPETLFQP